MAAGRCCDLNRLAQETSPYLLQHAGNPVDWYPWGEEALGAALERDVPILLSIGYAACHWCHVMERESFEDPAVAALMNERFVCIKVDREERPDVDAACMEACQAMTGQGGWPLNAFLTPDRQPFYVGTYYPPEPRHGMPDWRTVLEAVSTAWTDRRDEVADQGQRVAASLGAIARQDIVRCLPEETARNPDEFARMSLRELPLPTFLVIGAQKCAAHVGGDQQSFNYAKTDP